MPELVTRGYCSCASLTPLARDVDAQHPIDSDHQESSGEALAHRRAPNGLVSERIRLVPSLPELWRRSDWTSHTDSVPTTGVHATCLARMARLARLTRMTSSSERTMTTKERRTVTTTLLRRHLVQGTATNRLGLVGDLTDCGKIIIRDMGDREDARPCPWCYDL